MLIHKQNLLLATISTFSTVNHALDLTRVPGAAGEDVVDAVLQQITDSEFLKDDKQFLKRLALVSTGYGTKHLTYSDVRQHGGIWRIDEKKFLEAYNTSIMNRIIDRMELEIESWQSARKPLISGITTAVYLDKLQRLEPVPLDINDQADYFGKYFGKEIGKTSEDYEQSDK